VAVAAPKFQRERLRREKREEMDEEDNDTQHKTQSKNSCCGLNFTSHVCTNCIGYHTTPLVLTLNPILHSHLHRMLVNCKLRKRGK